MSGGTEKRFVIEAFDAARHDRDGFSCGAAQIDNYFKLSANKLSKAGNARVFVMTADNAKVMGFYALNAHMVDYRALPPQFARDRPNHGSIPAAFISMIGVDLRFQGKGYGGDLLADALARIRTASKDLGIAVAMLDILDDGQGESIARRKALYMDFGFKALETQKLRMWLRV
jgi:GNAT superfamily N-acetyltransferase